MAMSKPERDSGTAALWARLVRRARQPLLHLVEAYHYSGRHAKDPWQFGIELGQLLTTGLTVSDLRWLVQQKYLEHAVEITTRRDRRRVFRPVSNLALAERSCFLLTPAGLAALGEATPATTDGPACAKGQERLPPQKEGETDKPRWEADAHTLFWGERRWHFRRDAPHQEGILAAFQRQRWAGCVQVALEPAGGCAKASLHNAVKNLNRKVRPSLHFAQEGNGTRVSWEPRKYEPQ
jgi:hypothetical protein